MEAPNGWRKRWACAQVWDANNIQPRRETRKPPLIDGRQTLLLLVYRTEYSTQYEATQVPALSSKQFD